MIVIANYEKQPSMKQFKTSRNQQSFQHVEKWRGDTDKNNIQIEITACNNYFSGWSFLLKDIISD